ncbi:NADH-quinone oxidoreductase subunit J family protein [Desulfoferrobacter suflitae]|uniref:NADH-quinone oxidoreductase subunit J family protein n=1 Tax=Desulfoferrobacter suflitae TaxID=2865782 RepID=UPI00216446D3|nr:NADH-quinone oxidoreductase subunit J [Desulfoferrobacter suflitae]MCK8600328.1 NADH-quinone oxidoreductase subunit J [Desulfoferrobacter suflitae]
MTLHGLIFYLLASVILASTGMAITRRNLVHAVLYLVFSFIGSALLFCLFGAPFLALLQVIIYAGAIMVVFLFIVMMVKPDLSEGTVLPLRQLLPMVLFGFMYAVVGVLVAVTDPAGRAVLETAVAKPTEFGHYVFARHYLAVEIISLILLIGLMGALHLGREKVPKEPEEPS